MNKNLKKYFLLGSISLVGVVSTVAVSCGVKETPSNPAKPTKIAKPVKPVSNPDSSAKPTTPEKPINPVSPSKPNKPEINIQKPVDPIKPTEVPINSPVNPAKPISPDEPINPVDEPNTDNENEERIRFLAEVLDSVKVLFDAQYFNVYNFPEDKLLIDGYAESLYSVDMKIVKRDNENGSVTVSLVVSEKNGNLKSKSKEITINNFKKLSNDEDTLQKELLKIELDYPNKANVKASEALTSVVEITGYNKIRYEAKATSAKPNPKNPTELIVEVIMWYIIDTNKPSSLPVTRILAGFKSP